MKFGVKEPAHCWVKVTFLHLLLLGVYEEIYGLRLCTYDNVSAERRVGECRDYRTKANFP